MYCALLVSWESQGIGQSQAAMAYDRKMHPMVKLV